MGVGRSTYAKVVRERLMRRDASVVRGESLRSLQKFFRYVRGIQVAGVHPRP